MHTTPSGDPTAAAPDDRLWNADYLKVLATNCANAFAFYLVTPLLPLYLSETFAAPKDIIGLALSGYAVTWPSAPGRTYTLLAVTNLTDTASPAPVATLEGTGAPLSVPIPDADKNPIRFFRLSVSLSPTNQAP